MGSAAIRHVGGPARDHIQMTLCLSLLIIPNPRPPPLATGPHWLSMVNMVNITRALMVEVDHCAGSRAEKFMKYDQTTK